MVGGGCLGTPGTVNNGWVEFDKKQPPFGLVKKIMFKNDNVYKNRFGSNVIYSW